jgi:hypothetical protein
MTVSGLPENVRAIAKCLEIQVTGHKRKRKRGNDQSLLDNYEIIKECNRPTAPLLELILKKIIQEKPPPGALHLPSWIHIIPIITPSYPSMSSSYNLDIQQLRRIHDEMIHSGMSRRSSCPSTVGKRTHQAIRITMVPKTGVWRGSHLLLVLVMLRRSRSLPWASKTTPTTASRRRLPWARVE